MIYILSGASGAGKSTYAKVLPTRLVFSADSFFCRGGVYSFDPQRLGEAHATCFRGVLNALAFDPELSLIVDNTNTAVEEISPYVMAANAYGQDHQIITLLCSAGFAAKRTTHGVPLRTIEKQVARIQGRKMPLSWNHVTLFVEEET